MHLPRPPQLQEALKKAFENASPSVHAHLYPGHLPGVAPHGIQHVLKLQLVLADSSTAARRALAQHSSDSPTEACIVTAPSHTQKPSVYVQARPPRSVTEKHTSHSSADNPGSILGQRQGCKAYLELAAVRAAAALMAVCTVSVMYWMAISSTRSTVSCTKPNTPEAHSHMDATGTSNTSRANLRGQQGGAPQPGKPRDTRGGQLLGACSYNIRLLFHRP